MLTLQGEYTGTISYQSMMLFCAECFSHLILHVGLEQGVQRIEALALTLNEEIFI